jgi:hypothetical protein
MNANERELFHFSQCCIPITTTTQFCHPERVRAIRSAGSKGESKDPENACSTMPPQGILTKLLWYLSIGAKRSVRYSTLKNGVGYLSKLP